MRSTTPRVSERWRLSSATTRQLTIRTPVNMLNHILPSWGVSTRCWTDHDSRYPHSSDDQSPLPIRSSPKHLEGADRRFDRPILLQLLPHLVELLDGRLVVALALAIVQTLEHGLGLLEAVFAHQPAGRVRQPGGPDEHEEGWGGLESEREAPGEGRVGAAGGDEVDAVACRDEARARSVDGLQRHTQRPGLPIHEDSP